MKDDALLVRMDDDVRAMLAALAADAGEPQAVVVRRLIREAHRKLQRKLKGA